VCRLIGITHVNSRNIKSANRLTTSEIGFDLLRLALMTKEPRLMHINQVSAVLDNKLLQIDKQLEQLDTKITATADTHEQERLTQDKVALEAIRRKMIKSKELAWQAHHLQDNNNEQKRARQRLIGLVLCGLSLLGAVVLIGLVIAHQ